MKMKTNSKLSQVKLQKQTLNKQTDLVNPY